MLIQKIYIISKHSLFLHSGFKAGELKPMRVISNNNHGWFHIYELVNANIYIYICIYVYVYYIYIYSYIFLYSFVKIKYLYRYINIYIKPKTKYYAQCSSSSISTLVLQDLHLIWAALLSSETAKQLLSVDFNIYIFTF